MNSKPSLAYVNQQIKKMRLNGVAFDLDQYLVSLKLNKNAVASLKWLNNPVWWSSIENKSCILTPRKGDDVPFVRSLWADQDFIHSFHRLAKPLPDSDEQLTNILNDEWSSPLDLNNSLHWIIRCPKGDPYGLLSLVEISCQHRRSEVVLGVLPGTPFGVSTGAMLTLFEFYFKKIKFNKMISNVFEDNPRSLKSTLHLGFRVEGKLAKHTLDPQTNQYLDITQLGLLIDDAYCQRNARLAKKLFG
jgi:RimJ/RimL family protein N-acetyltransferase